MTDSRAKGARGEYLVRDMLRRHTGLEFERIPSSGALHYLKGDLYVPHKHNLFCIEVKNYKDSHFNDKVFTSKSNQWIKWWSKLCKQAQSGEPRHLDVSGEAVQQKDIIRLRVTSMRMSSDWRLQHPKKSSDSTTHNP